jgi:hypothetical protein
MHPDYTCAAVSTIGDRARQPYLGEVTSCIAEVGFLEVVHGVLTIPGGNKPHK